MIAFGRKRWRTMSRISLTASLPRVTTITMSGLDARIFVTSTERSWARGSKAMMITIPFVLFGVFRYLLLMHRRDLGEEPEEILLRDLPILACIAGWAVCAAVILAVT